MSESILDDRAALIRQLRQRMDDLRRAGVDRLPRPAAAPAPVLRAAPKPSRPEPDPVAPEPSAPPPPREVARPRPAEPVARPPAAPALAASLFEEPTIEAPALPLAERNARLTLLDDQVRGCTRCPHLAATRTKTVFGTGNPAARLMFIGEGPGADEDRTGEPFVGKAGQLLNDMITKGMGLQRGDVYIANIVKCRPLNTAADRTSDNRPPTPEEIANCLGYLEEQIAIVRPEFLCLLGKTPASTLLETSLPMGRLRGKWYRYRGIPTIVTYHPAALLRNVAWKKDTWEDLKLLMNAMGLKPPERKK